MIIAIILLALAIGWLALNQYQEAQARDALEARIDWQDQKNKDLTADISRMQHRYGNALQEHASEIHFLKRASNVNREPLTSEEEKKRKQILEELSASVRANMGH